MAKYEAQTCITLPASADLSSNQYYFVSVASDGEIELTGDGAAAVGVLQDTPDAVGRAGAVAIGGRVKVAAGGTVTAGGAVACDATGRAVDATSGDVILGVAIEGTTTAGAVVSIVFQPRGTV